jgi:hypothetical protein
VTYVTAKYPTKRAKYPTKRAVTTTTNNNNNSYTTFTTTTTIHTNCTITETPSSP